jgi:hypothetical protein
VIGMRSRDETTTNQRLKSRDRFDDPHRMRTGRGSLPPIAAARNGGRHARMAPISPLTRRVSLAYRHALHRMSKPPLVARMF